MGPINIYLNPPPPQPAWVDLLKWVLQILSGLFLLVTFLVTYRHNVNVRAGDLLLKLEDAFKGLGAKLAFLEYGPTCYDPIRPILARAATTPDLLNEAERATLRDIDEVVRFLYVCTLHTGDRIPPVHRRRWRLSRLPEAYYFYLNRLYDQKERPELYIYLSNYYPSLFRWLRRNKTTLAAYAAVP